MARPTELREVVAVFQTHMSNITKRTREKLEESRAVLQVSNLGTEVFGDILASLYQARKAQR